MAAATAWDTSRIAMITAELIAAGHTGGEVTTLTSGAVAGTRPHDLVYRIAYDLKFGKVTVS